MDGSQRFIGTVGQFPWLALVDLYPLHLYALLLMGLLELSKLALHRMGIFNTPAFGVNNFQNFTSSLFMLDSTGIGVQGRLAWNFPSWSVSAEFISSLLFAALLFIVSRIKQLGFLVFAIPLASMGLLYANHGNLSIGYTFDFGFFVGVIAYRAIPFLGNGRKGGAATSALELFSIVLIVVILFSRESGVVSACLKAPFFQALGKYSYSIYLNNMVVIICADILFIRALKMPVDFAGWMPVIILLLVIVYSKYTYEYIETRFYKIRSSLAPR